jgi:hypothetical protein
MEDRFNRGIDDKDASILGFAALALAHNEAMGLLMKGLEATGRLQDENQRLARDLQLSREDLESLRQQLWRQPSIGAFDSALNDLIDLGDQSERIPRIKHLREMHGIGLKEAKDTVDFVEKVFKAGRNSRLQMDHE